MWVSYTTWGAGVCTSSVLYYMPLDYFTVMVLLKQRNTKLNILLISQRQIRAKKSNWWATSDAIRKTHSSLLIFSRVLFIVLHYTRIFMTAFGYFQISDLHGVLERLQNNPFPALKKKYGYLPTVGNVTTPSIWKLNLLYFKQVSLSKFF